LSSPRPSPQTRSTIPIAKIKKNQATFERGFVLATPVDHHNMKLPNSKKNTKIKQNQATFERGLVLATPVDHNKKTQNSSTIKPSLNEVLSTPRMSPQASK
jgi:hypothetical protein